MIEFKGSEVLPAEGDDHYSWGLDRTDGSIFMAYAPSGTIFWRISRDDAIWFCRQVMAFDPAKGKH